LPHNSLPATPVDVTARTGLQPKGRQPEQLSR